MAEHWSRDHIAHLSLVRLDTGQVFPAQFSYHGPDTDIRCAAVTVKWHQYLKQLKYTER